MLPVLDNLPFSNTIQAQFHRTECSKEWLLKRYSVLTRQVADVLGGIRGRVDDGETSRHDAEEQGDRDAGDGGDVQLFDEKGALVVEDVNEVHVEVSLAEAVVQVLAAFEQPEEDGS